MKCGTGNRCNWNQAPHNRSHQGGGTDVRNINAIVYVLLLPIFKNPLLLSKIGEYTAVGHFVNGDNYKEIDLLLLDHVSLLL